MWLWTARKVKGKGQVVHLVCAIQKDETALLRPCTSEASIRYTGIYLHSSIRDRWFLYKLVSLQFVALPSVWAPARATNAHLSIETSHQTICKIATRTLPYKFTL